MDAATRIITEQWSSLRPPWFEPGEAAVPEPPPAISASSFPRNPNHSTPRLRRVKGAGSLVGRSKVISKIDRREQHEQTRIEADIGPVTPGPQRDKTCEEKPCSTNGDKSPTLQRHVHQEHKHFARKSRQVDTGSWIINLIFVLLIFGGTHIVFNHLLNLSRAAAQCSPLTSYIPVTYTVTSYVTPTITVTETASAAPVQVETTSVSPTSTSTRTSVSTYYSTITISASPEVTTSGLFSYIVNSGTTSWFNSVAPSSGESLVYVTTTIYVQPSVTSTLDIATSPLGTVTSALDTVTVSPPPYILTTYSIPEVDVTSTLTTTRTSTTTLSSVVTQLRSSFTPIGSLGWNSSSTDLIGPTGNSYISGSGITVTGTVFLSTGIPTTSTSYSTLTTVFTQSAQSSLAVTSTGPATVSLETISVTGSLGSSATSILAASSTAASPTTQPLSSSGATGSIGLTSSGFIPSTLPVLSSYGGYGGLSTLSTIVAVSSASSTPSLASSLVASSSQASSSQGSTLTGSSVASPLTGSSSLLVQSSSQSVSTSSSPIGSATSLGSSRSASSPASSVASFSIPASSGATSVINSSFSASSPASLSSYAGPSSTLSSSSGIQGSSTLPSTPGLSSSGSSSTKALSTVISSVTVSVGPTSGGQASSSALASSSSTTTSIPAYSGPQPYGIPSSSSPAVTSSTALSSLPGGYGGPSSLNGVSSVSSGTSSPVSASSSLSTVLTLSTSRLSSSSLTSAGSPTTAGSTLTTSVSVSSIVSSASATPSACGEYGNFTLNFDDLPNFSGGNNTDITQAPPIFNGYHHFAFSDGYVYAPAPSDPFVPRSAPHLAVFLGNASDSGVNNTSSALGPTSGLIRPGEFGDGSSAAQSAFWFNVYNVWLGCDNSGPEDCTYVLTAYVFDPSAQAERAVDTINATTSPCPGLQDCQLEQVSFPSTFQGLSGVQIQAYRGPDQVMFFMDDVSMGWYNNTCAAGLQRLRSPRGAAVARR